MSNDRPVNIVSSKGKAGASSPASTSSASGVTASSPLAKVDASIATIPAKPSWVTTPLYTDPHNTATQYAQQNPTAAGVQYIARMGQNPVAQWFGDWDLNVTSDVNSYVSAATTTNSVPQLVLYNIPERDCGGYSSGGAPSAAAYSSWIQQVALGLGNRTAIVILEPDALAQLDCLSSFDQQARYQAIAQAVTILKLNAPHASVYIDAGNPTWQTTKTMAARLKLANVANADGFSLNVSNFASTAVSRTYGDALSSLIGYKHYVIDTSRNGAGNVVNDAACNPSFAALGADPTTNTGSELNDALLWIKIPWESDGSCNGGPEAGSPFWSFAIQLAQNAGW